MQRIACVLTVYFDDPFWVGVYERITGGKLEVCKVTFGAEPKDNMVYAFFLENWSQLRFSPSIDADARSTAKINPKRMQRAINKRLMAQGVGTKSQQALKQQHAAQKKQYIKEAKKLKENNAKHQFKLQREKRKEKHKGH